MSGFRGVKDAPQPVCSACREDLEERGDEVRCVACGADYPSRGGIVDLRRPEARTEGDLRQAEIFSAYAAGGAPSTPVDSLECRNDMKSLFFRKISDSLGWPGRGTWTIDLGSFDGSLSRNWTSRYGTGIVGVDASPDAILRARRADPFENRYHLAGLEALPFPAASFDAAISLDVLEHVADPSACLEEAARVLRPGAPFLFYAVSKRTTGTLDWWDHHIRRLLGHPVPACCGDCPEAGHNAAFFLDPRAFPPLLQTAGFRIEGIRPFHSFFTALYDDWIRPRIIGARARAGMAEPPPAEAPRPGQQAVLPPERIPVSKRRRLRWVERALGVAEILDLPWTMQDLGRGFLAWGRRAS